jgi:transposase-like protein
MRGRGYQDVARYGQAFRDRIVARLLPPESAAIEVVSREVGVSISTLERWRAQALAAPGELASSQRWTPAARLEAVIATAAMDEAARSAWCREQGLFPAELEAWKRDAMAGLGEPRAASAVEARQDRRRMKELERELHRKDKALAETAALLVLGKKLGLLPGSGVLASLSHQGCDEGAEKGFAAAPGVVHELEESEIERQLLLRDAPVRPQPGAQQGPRPLHGVDVDLAEAVAILVARVLPAAVTDRLVPIAPGRQAGVDVVLVGVDAGALGDGGLDDGLDRRLLHIGQHAQHHLSAALDRAEDGRLLLLQRAAARRARQPAAAAESPPLATAAGWPLCPATT